MPDTSDNKGERSSRYSAPAVSLPKGGGAIRGIGEKFAANPVTGTDSMSVPLAFSQGDPDSVLPLALNSTDTGAKKWGLINVDNRRQLKGGLWTNQYSFYSCAPLFMAG